MFGIEKAMGEAHSCAATASCWRIRRVLPARACRSARLKGSTTAPARLPENLLSERLNLFG